MICFARFFWTFMRHHHKWFRLKFNHLNFDGSFEVVVVQPFKGFYSKVALPMRLPWKRASFWALHPTKSCWLGEAAINDNTCLSGNAYSISQTRWRQQLTFVILAPFKPNVGICILKPHRRTSFRLQTSTFYRNTALLSPIRFCSEVLDQIQFIER